MKLQNHPKVGIGVMVVKDGKVLPGKRTGSHGAEEFAFPGGHLEYMESFADCARREIAEECVIKIKNIRFQFLANLTKYAPKHHVHIGLTADWESGNPKFWSRKNRNLGTGMIQAICRRRFLKLAKWQSIARKLKRSITIFYNFCLFKI